MNELKPWLDKLAAGERLSEAQSLQAFDLIFEGTATPAQLGAFLMALRVRGETVEEIVGAARSMRARALKIAAPDDAIDTCGTGGDASGSFNISTTAALVIAGCGVPVAKHGNRSLSSRSGSADVLTALGVDIEAPAPMIERAIAEIGIGFLMAPLFHKATRAVGPVRVELGTRTIFNLMGPLTNPAGVTRQLVGVYAARWVRPMAEVLQRLGSSACWVVHGDGLDELTTTGPNEVAILEGGRIETRIVRAEDAGLKPARKSDLAGGTPEENAAMLKAILGGGQGPLRDVVLLNAAAALIIAGRAATLRDGVELAAASIDSGRAAHVLDKLVRFSTVTA